MKCAEIKIKVLKLFRECAENELQLSKKCTEFLKCQRILKTAEYLRKRVKTVLRRFKQNAKNDADIMLAVQCDDDGLKF